MPICENKLTFRPDGTFRILFLSDFQETYEEFDPRTMAGVNAVLDAEKPDLVVLCGDNCNGPAIHSSDDLRRYLGRMLEPLVSRAIPFAHVNGNHDYDAAVPMDEQMRIWQAVPGCMTETVPGIPGWTNFCIPLFSSDGERIVSAVWGLDTGHSMEEIREGLTGDALIKGLPRPASIWNIVRFEQQMWYWNRSVELERAAGGKAPGVMAMHVSPWEFDYMRTYRESLGVSGNTDEQYGLGALNSGIFATLVQRGDIKCVCTGHTHINTCEADYCGIRMCSVGSAGYSAYGEDSERGGKVIELNEAAPEKITVRTACFREYV